MGQGEYGNRMALGITTLVDRITWTKNGVFLVSFFGIGTP